MSHDNRNVEHAPWKISKVSWPVLLDMRLNNLLQALCTAVQLCAILWINRILLDLSFYVKLFWGHTKLNPNSKYLWLHYALHPLFGCPWQKLNARSYPKLTLYIFLITITGLVTDIRQTTFRIVMKLFSSYLLKSYENIPWLPSIKSSTNS